MTVTVYAKHEPYWNEGHLGKVIDQMRTEGEPTIRVMEFNGRLFATEASHRLAAAAHLGKIPKFVIEIPDAGEGTNEFWARIAPDLPRYDYEHSHVLDLTQFKFEGATV